MRDTAYTGYIAVVSNRLHEATRMSTCARYNLACVTAFWLCVRDVPYGMAWHGHDIVSANPGDPRDTRLPSQKFALSPRSIPSIVHTAGELLNFAAAGQFPGRSSADLGIQTIQSRSCVPKSLSVKANRPKSYQPRAAANPSKEGNEWLIRNLNRC